jgi:hypothetical protein
MSAWDVHSLDRLWIRHFSTAIINIVLIDKTELWVTFADTTLLVLDAFNGAHAVPTCRGGLFLPPTPGCSLTVGCSAFAVWTLHTPPPPHAPFPPHVSLCLAF